MSTSDNVPIGFLMQVVGSDEVQQKIGALGGALQQFDSKAAATAQTTGQTLPAGFEATSKGAERATKSVQSAGQGFQTAALGLTSAASGAFALYNQYDRLEKIQVRIASGEKAVTAAERAALDSKRALNELVAKGITAGSQYESAVLRVSQAQQQQAIAADRLNIAQNDLTQGQIGFALTVMPTVFSAVSGVTAAMTALRTVQATTTATQAASVPVTVADVGAKSALAAATGTAAVATGGLSIAMRILHIAMGPVGWVILAIGAAMTVFATNAFGVRDAINAAGKAIGDAVPAMRPLLEALQFLAETIFPDAAKEAHAMAGETDSAMSAMSTGVVSQVGRAESAIERLKKAFEDASATSGRAVQQPTRLRSAEEDTDPLLGRIVTGLSGKRLELAEEKRKIIAEISELVSGIRTPLEDIPTDLPALATLMDNIRSELRDTLNVDFDFDAADIGAELEELKDGLTRRVGPLSIILQVKHDELQRELDSVTAQIEKTEERIRTLGGGRGLDELREAFSAGTLTEEGDEFVVHMLGKLDNLGEKAVEIKGKLRDITHVEFTPTDATSSAAFGDKTRGEVLAMKEANREMEKAVAERVRILKTLTTLTTGTPSTFKDVFVKQDLDEIRKLTEVFQADLKENLNVDFDFGADDLNAELQKVRDALSATASEATASSGQFGQGVSESLASVSGSAATASSQVEASMSAMSSEVSGSNAAMSSSMLDLRGVFLNSFNLIGDAASIFARTIHKHSDNVIDDLEDMKKAMRDVGLSSSSARQLSDTASRSSNSSNREIRIDNKITIDGDLLKTLIKKVAVEQMSGNL